MQSRIKRGLFGTLLYLEYETKEGTVEEEVDITSFISLRTKYEYCLIGDKDVIDLVRELVLYAKKINEEGRSEDELILDPELVFINTLTDEKKFICSKGCESDIQESLLGLFEFIMERLDYNNYKAVRLVYGMYSMIMKGDYNLMALVA